MATNTVNRRRLLMGSVVLTLLLIIGTATALVVCFTVVNKIAKAAVVTNGHQCAEIGTSILDKGGNVADAAIATALCEGISNPQSMGLGGGFLLTIYNRTTGEVWSLSSREVAPAAATEDMFHGDPNLSQSGGKSVAVPGELIGYWYLYKRFGGNLPWEDLVQPAIDLCKNGVYLTSYIADVLSDNKDVIYSDLVLRDIFIDPSTNQTYVEGQYVKRLRLAKTLEVIAVEGGYALHNGSLTEKFVNDIREKDGIITVEDMKNYEPEWQQPIHTTFLGNKSLYTAPLPGSGVILAFILNILDNFVDVNEPRTVTTYQRIIESFKFAYGRRTWLGDPNFANIEELLANLSSKSYAEEIRQYIFDNSTSQNASDYGATTSLVEDHGTAHISILAPNGDAVSITSTINYYFGAKFASNSTGIILNNEMDDFSSPNVTSLYDVPPSPANYIVSGKRPLSSMCPTIILDENRDVVMVTGAAGGTKITTTVALLIIKHLWFGMDLVSAMDDKRLHHQLFPMEIMFERPYATEDVDLVKGLSNIGHNYTIQDSDGFTSVTSISRDSTNGKVLGCFDKRRPGSISYLY